MDAALVSMLNQTLTRRPFVSRDRYNKKTYGAAVALKARVTWRPKLIRAPDGQEKMSSAEAWVDVHPAMDAEDEFTLPDGTTPPVLRIDRLVDEFGQPDHTKVFFG